MRTRNVNDANHPVVIELAHRSVEDAVASDHFDAHRINETSLGPVDGGIVAWRMLCIAFVFEALMWGFPMSFGVFQNYYSNLPQFSGDPRISVVGSVATGISYLGAPLTTPIMRRFSKHQTALIVFGWAVCLLSLVIGSFATTLATLILSQGIMYGVGFLLMYYPIIGMLNEHWIARRGMACGLMCASSGVSGVGMPFLVKTLLEKYGYPTTLRAIAIALAILTGPLLPLLKGRLPANQRTGISRSDWSFLKKPLFWVYTSSNILQGMGYFFPPLYLPSFASTIGLGATRGALLLALMSVAQVFGQITFGYLSDRRVPLGILIIVSTLAASSSTLAIWGLSQSLAPLAIFAVIYGFFGSAYVAMWARMALTVSTDPSAALPMFGMFCLQKGVGNVLSGPVGAALVDKTAGLGQYGGGVYGSIIIFAGSSWFASALAGCAFFI